ncbi:hypothetical protein Efla_000615 [Eimeria flavescens]
MFRRRLPPIMAASARPPALFNSVLVLRHMKLNSLDRSRALGAFVCGPGGLACLQPLSSNCSRSSRCCSRVSCFRRRLLPTSLHARPAADCRVRADMSLQLRGLHAAAATLDTATTRNSSSSSSSSRGTHVLRVPTLGESITEGTVAEWRCGVGSVVRAQEVVCVLETDKVSVDIHSDVAGRILSIAVDKGGTAVVGGELAVIEPLPDDAAADSGSSGAAGAGGSSPQQPTAADSAVSTAAAAGAAAPRHGFRKPLILFRSVRNKLEKLGLLAHNEDAGAAARGGRGVQTPQTEEAKPARSGLSSGSVKATKQRESEDLSAFLGRPPLTPEEIEAINDGGIPNLDVAARAWRVSLSFQPSLCSTDSREKSQAGKRASA